MISLEALKKSKNIVDLLDNDELQKIANQVVRGYEIDEESRLEWSENVQEAMKIAKQKTEPKNHPWPGASNIKYPIISKAVINYSARVLPEIIQNDRVVKCKIYGRDPQGIKFKRADNVSEFLSYQFLTIIPGWRRGLDNLLQICALTGMAFKKTYYDPITKAPCSDLCLPDRICVNHNTISMDEAERVTHILEMSQNSVIQRQRMGLFNSDVSIESLRLMDLALGENEEGNIGGYYDEDFKIYLLEQHCFLDLDEDGYKEPYVVTVHKQSKQVLRIYNRFSKIEYNDKKEIISITPEQYFTSFHFICSPDGGFYSLGFGTLLLHLNLTINTLLNQLIDSGTLSNLSTFLGTRGLRIKNGEFKIKNGEINILDAASTVDISKAIYQIPFKEPSTVLFKLFETLLRVCDDLTSTSEEDQGKQPSQNVSSGTVNQLIEQRSKIFTAINERISWSLQEEYEKVYRINNKYLSNKEYRDILGDPSVDVKIDFELDTLNVLPVADPAMSTVNQRLSKAAALMALKTADPRAVDTFILESLQLEKSQIESILPPPNPHAAPSLQDQLTQSEISLNQANAAKLSNDTQLDQQKIQLEALKAQDSAKMTESQVQESAVRQWKMQNDAADNKVRLATVHSKMQSEQAIKAAHLQLESQKNKNDLLMEATNNHTDAVKVLGDIQNKAAKLVSDSAKDNNKTDNAQLIEDI